MENIIIYFMEYFAVGQICIPSGVLIKHDP